MNKTLLYLFIIILINCNEQHDKGIYILKKNRDVSQDISISPPITRVTVYFYGDKSVTIKNVNDTNQFKHISASRFEEQYEKENN